MKKYASLLSLFLFIALFFMQACGPDHTPEQGSKAKGGKKITPPGSVNKRPPEPEPFEKEIAGAKKLVDLLKTPADMPTKAVGATNELKELLKEENAPFYILWSDATLKDLEERAQKLNVKDEFDAAIKKLKIEGELQKKGITNLLGFTCYMNSALQIMLLSNTVSEELNKRLKHDNLFEDLMSVHDIEEKYNADKNFLRGLVKFSIEARNPQTDARKLAIIAKDIYKSAVKAIRVEKNKQSDSSEFFTIITDLLHIHPLGIITKRFLYHEDDEKISDREKKDHAAMLTLNMEKKDTTLEELFKNFSAEKREDKASEQIQIHDDGTEEAERLKNPNYEKNKDERKYLSENYSHHFTYNSYIKDLPKEIFISLVRFSFEDNRKSKIDNKVTLPGEIISLKDIIDPTIKDENKEYNYRIKAVSIHGGSAEGGHYTAYGRYGDDWYSFNDSVANKVNSFDDIKEAMEKGAYFYLLEQVE